ncbi:MAG: hypothetical protein ABWW69_07855 [Pyrodictiaceae archaeon]
MGVLDEAAGRGLLRLAGILVSVVSGVIIARRLDPSDYAVFQVVAKRVDMVSGVLAGVAGFWAYRYSAIGIPGVVPTYMLVVFTSGLLGLVASVLMAWAAGGSPQLLLAASVAGFSLVLFARFSFLVVSLRPVYSELVILARRVAYVVLVALLVYLAGAGALGALASLVASSLLGFLLLVRGVWDKLREPLCRRCLREWLRGAYVPLMSWAGSLLAGLDAVLVALLAGSYPVAAFFASVLVISLAGEAVGASIQHLQAYVLRTGDRLTGVKASGLIAIVVGLVAGYAIARPEQLIAALNPVYVGASGALRVYAVASLIGSIGGPLAHIVAGSDRSMAGRPGKVLTRLSALGLTSSLLYLGLIVFLVATRTLDPVVSWVLALLVSGILRLAGTLWLSGRMVATVFVKEGLARAAGYMLLAYLLASLLAPPGYKPRFFDNLWLLAWGFLLVAVPYLLVALAFDPLARRGLRGLVAYTTSTARALLARRRQGLEH